MMDYNSEELRKLLESFSRTGLNSSRTGGSQSASVVQGNVTGDTPEAQHLLNRLFGGREETPAGASATVQYSLSNGVETVVDESPSPADLLKQYQADRDAKFLADQEAILKRTEELTIPQGFNRKKVPRDILEQVKSLPIYSRKEELVKLIQENQMVIIIGETGSGKSTQIPQYIVDANLAKGKIGITQPRRVAAKSLADRVSKETGVKLGTVVGYAVRFDKAFSDATIIKYMTDGLLVKECTNDPNLNSYSVIIIDEAHERSINSDICFGLLKKAARNRPDLKIIISSATLEEDKFSKYFNNAPVFNVSGRSFDVEVLYEPKNEAETAQGAVDVILKIHRRHATGDVLVFLAGQEEIEEVWELLENKARENSIGNLLILPCYGALPLEEQQKIFEETPPGYRKVVLATNIAETSITIDGIVYVVDCGYFKQGEYNSRTGIRSLVKRRIAKHQAIQRAGRAGRTCPGKCYRLYSQTEFRQLVKANEPEIKRCNLEAVILDLIAMGVKNPVMFEFMDSPKYDAIMEGMEHLKEMQALDANLSLTPLGKKMSQFPLDPPLSRVVLESARLNCSADILKIVSLLSIQYNRLFNRPKNRRTESDRARALFNHQDGDHLSLLKIYDQWEASGYNEHWCKKYFIQHRYLCEAHEIREQLREILQSQHIQEKACPNWNYEMSERIRRAFTAGYFRRIAQKSPRGYGYQIAGKIGAQDELYLYRSSALFPNQPPRPFLLYHDIMKTAKAYMTLAMEIEFDWVREYAPEYARQIFGR